MSAGEVAGVRADVLAVSVMVIGGCWAARVALRLLDRRDARDGRWGFVAIGADTDRGRLLPFQAEDADDAAAERLLAEGLSDVDAELVQRMRDEGRRS